MPLTLAANNITFDDGTSLSSAYIPSNVGGVPVGAIIAIPGTSAPSGWLKVNGAELLRADFPALWAYAQGSSNLVSETTWTATNQGSFSTGNTTTTFRIPDLRGEFIRALADGKAIDTGRVIGTNQADGIKSHTHSYLDRTIESSNSPAPYGGSGYGSQGLAAGGPTWRYNYVLNTLVENQSPTPVDDTRPRNIALLYCIKF